MENSKVRNNEYIYQLKKGGEKMVKYASYWDTSNWHSYVEVLNLQDQRADYRIVVYDRDGSVCWQDIRTLTPHAAERIFINQHVPEGDRREGFVVVEPVREGDEFPSVLIIYAEGQHWKEGIRFVPFTRVP
jgi:hypothetical protein